MAWGITSTGFLRPVFSDCLEETKSAVRTGAHKNLSLASADPLGALIQTISEREAAAWEQIESAANVLDRDNADDFAAEAQAGLLGLSRNPATRGTVTVTCSLEEGFSATAEEMVVNVTGKPANRWRNIAAVAAVAADGDYEIEFEAETAGVYTALTGTLTTIAGGLSGWTAATNAADATPGKGVETIEALLVRKDQRLAQLGTSGTAAMRAALEALTGVISVRIYTNETDTTDGDGIPGHSIRVVVYDGVGVDADDDEIAAAILANHVAGIGLFGAASGDALDVNDESRSVAFDRATITDLYCEITVTVGADGADSDAIKAAIVAAVDSSPGASIYMQKLRAAVMAVEGVLDVTVFELDSIDPPVNAANFSAGVDEAFSLDSGDIVITGL